MQISVAMCTYNGARFLRQQLESISAQTTLPHELVVCDDGSSDGTPAILEEFSRSAPFAVHLHRNPGTLGSTRNFEQAIRLCRGDAIALADQDDEWLPSKLAILSAVLAEDPKVAGVFSNAHLIDESGNAMPGDLWSRAQFSPARQLMFAEGKGALALVARDTVTGCTLLFRRSFAAQVLPIAPGWIHDGWIALVLAAISELRPVPACTMRYRLHSAQQVGLQETAWHDHLDVQKGAALSMHGSIASRLESMAERLNTLGAPPAVVEAVGARARFLRHRVELLGKPRGLRFVSALKLLPSYREHASGWASVLRDVAH